MLDTSTIPRRLQRLPELAYNLLWTWRPETIKLFKSLDAELWESTEHNPVHLLRDTANLASAAEDPGFVADYERAISGLDTYLSSTNTWMAHVYPDAAPVAYFSAEFGLHESLPIYSGGLGVLAGDHIKSASDLGVPLVGVGILYNQGYFRQRLAPGGGQEEVYEALDPENRPVQPARTPDGEEVSVEIELPGRTLVLKVWKVEVGRAGILLLDADLPENSPEDRELTARLYGGDNRTRIAQELILGVGGVRALRATGHAPALFHMNEGHAAFCVLERTRELVATGETFESAREKVVASTVFTTHTPVPAGHDAFDPELFAEFTARWPESLSISAEELWSLGHKQEAWGPMFNMTVLAMKNSSVRNAVSALHGEVSVDMWSYLFEGDGARRDGQKQITHVTNGVHTWSWLSPALAELFEKHSGGRAWRESVADPSAWSFVEGIPNADLWNTHTGVKRASAEFLNGRLQLQRERNAEGAERDLDPDTLTIGFARRFATYKRATLLLSDAERLRQIVTDSDRPVQFIFAGKAHPADGPAKEFIRALYAAAGDFDGRLLVLEDYDMNVARHLVQGVDVWLNNPRRPLEASGTSGQKAALNGAPNLSVLDGWWPEAYNGLNGWIIGEEKEYASEEEQDTADSRSLYETLENSLVPLYYDRDESGVPGGWVEVMKESISTVAPQFSTQRMVRDYVHKLYAPRTVGL